MALVNDWKLATNEERLPHAVQKEGLSHRERVVPHREERGGIYYSMATELPIMKAVGPPTVIQSVQLLLEVATS
jgi:hypothetical protein